MLFRWWKLNSYSFTIYILHTIDIGEKREEEGWLFAELA
jgi:hypothetical protein